jgi:hypothetical protein
MTTPTVKELPLRLEPVTRDDFIGQAPRPLHRATGDRLGRTAA